MNAIINTICTSLALKGQKVLKAACFETPLGPMLAISDEVDLYLVEFVGTRHLEREVERLKKHTRAVIIEGSSRPIRSITAEIEDYFKGTLKEFKTPIKLVGTPFQQLVWQELMRTPYGQTRSYAAQAAALGKQTAYRAVANANGVNKFAIVIPCHRIVSSDGGLGGYAGGIERKKKLLTHEKQRAPSLE